MAATGRKSAASKSKKSTKHRVVRKATKSGSGATKSHKRKTSAKKSVRKHK